MHTLFVLVQFICSIALIAIILLQHGKGADAGAAFGSGASGTVFGARGASNFMSRTTAILAAIFFISSLALAYLVKEKAVSGSVVDQMSQPAQEQPAAPAAAPAASTPAPAAGEAPAQAAPAEAAPAAEGGADDAAQASQAAPAPAGDAPKIPE